MSGTTIARPYARAIFEHALTEKKMATWSAYLLVLAQASLTPEAASFFANPSSTEDQQIQLLQAVCQAKFKVDPSLDNLIHLLAKNKRLMLLPEIKALYEVHRAEQEKTLVVQVNSFLDVSPVQQQQMIKSLSLRLQRNVTLEISIDTALLGGAVIQAGDLVIDGSVRGKLNKLSTGLAA